MSAAGVFKLIANDGKADRLIMATQLLNKRIAEIMMARQRAGQADVTPTLLDLERTHVLFVNAHFKPYAAIGYEYNKVRPQSGNPALGNNITFSIPQFGDFFHDMVGRQVLSAFGSALRTAPAKADVSSGGTVYPADGKDWDGTNALTGATYLLVDAFGNTVTDGAVDSYRNLVRYCEFPGERLYQNVKFDVNGNPLDEYTDVTATMLRKFTIGADKLTGYKRLVGQEVAREGFSGPKLGYAADGAINTSTNSANPYTTLSGGVPTIPQQSINPVSATDSAFIAQAFPDNAWDLAQDGSVDHTTDSAAAGVGYLGVSREALQYVDGPQTPKYQQPQLEIWNKLRFWFNDDVRLAIPSVSIPFGQRFITIDLAAQNLIAFEFPGLYIKQTHHVVTSGAAASQSGVRTVTYRPWLETNTAMDDITLSRVELYVNNVFVNPEIHDIFVKRIGFSLIRVYRHHRVRSNSSDTDERLLSQLKWPIEYMFVGLRPTWNVSSANPNQHRDWHRMTKVNDLVHNDYHLSEAAGPDGTTLGSINATSVNASRVGQIVPNTCVRELKTADTISLTAHGINIHDNFPTTFFNSYNPFHYGGKSIITPSDEGAMMINFAFYPGSYQPSGHFNTSRARELFLSWTTRYVGASTPADLLVSAVAINFLLITDGSAVLRYST